MLGTLNKKVKDMSHSTIMNVYYHFTSSILNKRLSSTLTVIIPGDVSKQHIWQNNNTGNEGGKFHFQNMEMALELTVLDIIR